MMLSDYAKNKQQYSTTGKRFDNWMCEYNAHIGGQSWGWLGMCPVRSPLSRLQPGVRLRTKFAHLVWLRTLSRSPLRIRHPETYWECQVLQSKRCKYCKEDANIRISMQSKASEIRIMLSNLCGSAEVTWSCRPFNKIKFFTASFLKIVFSFELSPLWPCLSISISLMAFSGKSS